MSDFGAINQFGSLTINGTKLKFEDFDKDNNGEISSEEYNALLSEIKLDTVELSSIDKNGDQILSKEEFSAWEEKIEMQDAVNGLASQISKDFAGKSQYLPELQEALKNYIEEFASSYTGEASGMVDAFKEALPAKYEAIKTELLAKDPATVKSAVLDELYAQLITNPATKSSEDVVSDVVAKRITSELEKEANNFIKSYKGTNLEADLKAHLEAFLNQSDASTMAEASAKFRGTLQTLGSFYDSNDLTIIKEAAKEFLQTAVDKGVSINLGGTNIRTTAAITSALAKFTDGEELVNALNDAINQLSTTTRKENIIADEALKAEEAANKAFTDIKGSEYAIDPSLIDWSKVDSRYFDGGDIYYKTKGDAKGKAYNEGFKLLTSNGMKSQVRAQIETMLKAKGVPFEKIEQVFENIYNQTAQDTLNTDGMITGRHKTWFRKAKARIDVKTLCDTFITNFNANIAKAIDELNKSDKDFDTIDLNLSGIGFDENGNKIETVNNDDILNSYKTGKPLTTKKHGADYYVKVAEQIIDSLKAQMMSKAKAMCSANGVKFDLGKFNTMFNNVKSMAVNAAVTGITSKGQNWGGTAAGAAGGIATGAATVIGTAATTYTVTAAGAAAFGVAAGTTLGGASSSLITAGLVSTSLATGPVGWIVGGVAALGIGLAAAFGFKGHHSSSTLNTKLLVDGFAETFKQTFTNWVEQEKAATNKPDTKEPETKE